MIKSNDGLNKEKKVVNRAIFLYYVNYTHGHTNINDLFIKNLTGASKANTH